MFFLLDAAAYQNFTGAFELDVQIAEIGWYAAPEGGAQGLRSAA